MVALFGLSTKGSPARTTRNPDIATAPPPYSQDHSDPAVFATATTTTTAHIVTTTTETTTHFFSLPLWRRRGTPAHAPRITAAMSTDELGVMHTDSGQALSPSSLHSRDKDLPPTPNASPPSLTPPNRRSPDPHSLHESDDTTRQARIQAESRSAVASVASSRASSLQPCSRSSFALGESPSASQPTVVLARAALGLGLPHGVPGVSASSSSLEVNTVSLFPPQSPITSRAQPRSLSIRHAKSFHREPGSAADDPPASAIRERRRTRGLSLGPLSLMSSDIKGKQRETDNDAIISDQKPLTRKSSFWSRKRVHSRPEPALAPPSPTPQPTLPAFPPVSPFNMNTPVPSPGLSANYPPDLQRRHSERSRKQSSPRKDDARQSPDQSPPVPTASIHMRRRRGSQRPQTADSGTSPRLSFFAESRPFMTSPTSSPLPTPQEQPVLLPPPPHSEPRTRAQTNPPLLHRLSVNLFGGSSSNSQTPTSTSSPNILDGQGLASPPSSLGSSRPSLSKPSVDIPKPRADEESPEVYLQRLVEVVSKTEVATVLASSADAFHARALHIYIERFNFVGDPLDVALRKLLMEVGLPRETQQIDRVIEAFAARYVQCNPNLFASDDHPYILAFSLIMLHTDAFNKSNKRKMTKPDYIKNTRLPGVAPEVLDCFYDNIVFAPFIFIEDPLDVNGQRGLVPEAISRRMSTINAPSPGALNGSGSTLLGKSNKIDPYYLITRNLLDELRVDVRALVPAESPYFYQGTAGPWNEDELQRAFALASMVEVVGLENRYLASPWFGMTVAGGPGPMFQSSLGSLPPLPPASGGVFVVKVSKVGLLLRKEDIIEGGRRALSRKWREWSVLLTGSQLLFFRDTTWASTIQAQAQRTNGQVLPQTSLPQPDEMLSVRDTIAVFDKSYTKYANTLRLVMPDGRQFLLQAQDEREMNEWIARINYASAFKTAGVRMRSLGLSSRDIELTGMAAAASHLKDVKHNLVQTPSPLVRTWNGRMSEDLDILSRGAGDSEPTLPSNASAEGSRARHSTNVSISSDPTTPPYENSSRLFKATFDEVKTELATAKWRSLDEMSIRSSRKRAYSLESVLGSPGFSPTGRSSGDVKPRLSSRPEIIKSKVEDLKAKIALARTQLDTDMRFVRNLAVLTPFQRATRDRVQAAVQNVAKRVMQVRLDMEKLVCHHDVLTADLAAEERDWQRTKRLAMRAATEKLASQREHDRAVEREAERVEEAERERLPKLTLSAYVDQTEPQSCSSPVTIPRTGRSAHSGGPDSSMAASFQSAGSGTSSAWHSRQRSATVTVSSPHSSTTSPVERGSYTASDNSLLDSPERQRATPLAAQNSMDSTTTTDEGGAHEKFYTAPEMAEEQAEEWNKTRAAKRVSLVKLPSDLRMSILFGKHAREEVSTPELPEDTAATPTSTSSPPRRSSLSPYDKQPGATVTMLDL
ncbi:hypothetical protein K466DRAFT_657839 [Polyporus arcularius HHB13444]|uniref:SEC7 domain-containing protein n=1 Tax=Polyporus arcularius HHB13444 TaxID=1314778 RepID=A0A5C3Q1R4_9APHY|nr:hypothetical protein K466DRAFT_657839 [Polyporus arcularius HHB13444]